MQRIALSLDLGGTNIRLAAVGEDGTIYARSRSATPKGSTSDEIINLIVKLADECRDRVPADSEIFAISAAVPATIDMPAGVLTKLPNLPVLEGVYLRDVLSERMGIAANLENDATAAAIGENWRGVSRGVDDSICVTLGTGVGGGLILNGSPFRGKDGTAGEVGHICVESRGVLCGCGGKGCIEQYASATAVIRMAREKGIQCTNAHDVFVAASDGNENAREVFRVMGSYLGIGFATLVNVLNPEMIVIGGGVAAAWELFIDTVRAEVHERAFREPAERVKIVRAELGDDAGILGAARSAFLLKV